MKFVVIEYNSDHEHRLKRTLKRTKQVVLEYRLDLNLELLQNLQTTLVIAKEGRCGVKCD